MSEMESTEEEAQRLMEALGVVYDGLRQVGVLYNAAAQRSDNATSLIPPPWEALPHGHRIGFMKISGQILGMVIHGPMNMVAAYMASEDN